MTKTDTLRKLAELTQGYGLYSQEHAKDPFFVARFAMATFGYGMRPLDESKSSPMAASLYLAV